VKRRLPLPETPKLPGAGGKVPYNSNITLSSPMHIGGLAAMVIFAAL
jgi:hypothetical protein